MVLVRVECIQNFGSDQSGQDSAEVKSTFFGINQQTTADLPSLAGQDAQEIARIAPMAMIFVSSKDASVTPPRNLHLGKMRPTVQKSSTSKDCF
jgi:hypothetical protein